MEKRDLSQLAVYEIDDEAKTLPVELLEPLYIKKTSEIIYIIKDHKLYGIVCLGDVLRNDHGRVKINTEFLRLINPNIIRAREIFREKRNINKIPVVNEQGELLADYSRWDDNLFIERNIIWFSNKKRIEKTLAFYEKIYLVKPNDSANRSYLYFKQCLDQFGVCYEEIKKKNCNEKCTENDIFIFLNEEEKRGTQCLLQAGVNKDKKPVNAEWITLKYFLLQIMKTRDLEVIGELANCGTLSNSNIDEKATVLFSELQKKGVHCLAIYANDSEKTDYAKQFKEELAERLQKSPCMKEVPWIIGDAAEKFWCELYLSEDYKSGKAQKELLDGWLRGRYENLNGNYCNMKNGRRITCYQPDEFIGTIYFLGPCMIFGAYVEDRYTIESYLQKKLLEMGFPYRVENYASPLRLDAELENRLMEIGNYDSNDIVIYLTQEGEVAGIQNCHLWDIYEYQDISTDWFTNWYLHCNHKVNEAIAAHILKLIEERLLKDNRKRNGYMHIDFCNVMKEYIYRKYLTKYFKNFRGNNYDTVGAIVMNCNPFSIGHRYLIEQAQKQVDHLIIFLVEEDEALFSFEERYRMVSAGIKDLDHLTVVPSGEFILSKNTFQEYFTKVETELIRLNAEYDINIFVDYIAQPLHITHRFAGEEPLDRVTQIYNEAMEKILPRKGISFVEIPRKEMQGKVISASRAREYLKQGEYSLAAELLPETTVSFITT